MENKYYQKHKDSEKKHAKKIKIFLTKKRQKVKKDLRKTSKSSCRTKAKLLEYMKNYYLAHKKVTAKSFNEILRIIKKKFFWIYFYGLFIEMLKNSNNVGTFWG